jgi:hypothetical protein
MKSGLCACRLNCAGIKSSAWAAEQRVKGDESIDTFICIFSPSKHVSVMHGCCVEVWEGFVKGITCNCECEWAYY